MNEVANLLLQEKPALALLSISNHGRTYASVISKEVDTTFAHATKILGRMEQRGLVAFVEDEGDNRIKGVELTEQGKRVADALSALVAAVEDRGKKRKGNKNRKKKTIPASEPDGRILRLSRAVEEIYGGELKGKDSLGEEEYLRIGFRLGPYKREIARLQKLKNQKSLSSLKTRIEHLMMLREKLYTKN